MMTYLRITFSTLLVVLAMLAAWIAVPSSVFLQPVSLSVSGRTLTMVRLTPFGDVTARWTGEITMLDRGGMECPAGGGTMLAQVVHNDLVRRDLGEWAAPCLDAGPPFVLRFEFQVMLFGLLPLRPVITAVTVKPVGAVK